MCTLVDILASCFFPAMWELSFLIPKIAISQIRQRMFVTDVRDEGRELAVEAVLRQQGQDEGKNRIPGAGDQKVIKSGGQKVRRSEIQEIKRSGDQEVRKSGVKKVRLAPTSSAALV